MAHRMIKALPAIAAALFTGIAGAQPALPTPAGMPAFDASGLEGAPAADSAAVSILPAPSAGEVIDPGQATEGPAKPTPGYRPLLPYAFDQVDALGLPEIGPAITESSGTWLRRGLWYADLDAVIMQRTWNSLDRPLIEEFDSVNIQSGASSIQVLTLLNTAQIQTANLGESSPGYDGSARLALGRFLFRDASNRDHTAEMVVFGGAELIENVGAEAQLVEAFEGLFLLGNPNNPNLSTQAPGDQRGLHVPEGIDGSRPLNVDRLDAFDSFDRARAMQIGYASRFSSWEWNYNVAQRMRKDRMELSPSGNWVRRASPGFTWDYLAGFRYFDVAESMAWLAQDIASVEGFDQATEFTRGLDTSINAFTGVDADGRYDIATSNDLFGFQLGFGITYETDRWNVSVSTKHGFYVNDARADTSLVFTDADDPTVSNYTTDLHENGVSYLAQGGVTARYHLRPNLSLRAGWEFMFLTGLALAPNQADFNPATAQLNLGGDVFYHGVSFGTEYYW